MQVILIDIVTSTLKRHTDTMSSVVDKGEWHVGLDRGYGIVVRVTMCLSSRHCYDGRFKSATDGAVYFGSE